MLYAQNSTPFGLFAAYYCGVTPEDGYQKPNIEEIARRHGMTADGIRQLLTRWITFPLPNQPTGHAVRRHHSLLIGIGLLLEFTAPVLVALWARFVWRERVSDRVWAALVLVLVGLALVAEVWSGLTLDEVGVAAGLGAAVALAIFYLAGERLVVRRDPISVVGLAMGAAAGFWAVVQPWWSFPFASLTETVELPGALALSPPVWTLALWTVVLGTIAPFVLAIGALRHLPATTVTIVATLEPVAASVVAWVWLGETLAAVQIVGGAVVLVGILLAEAAR